MTEFTCSPLLPRPHQQPPKGCQGCRICTASAEIVKPAYYRPDQPRAHLEPKETTTTKMCDIMAFSGLEIRLSHNSLPNQEVGCFFQILNYSQMFRFWFIVITYVVKIVLSRDNENVRHNGLFRPRTSTFTQQPPQPRGRMLFADFESFIDFYVSIPMKFCQLIVFQWMCDIMAFSGHELLLSHYRF